MEVQPSMTSHHQGIRNLSDRDIIPQHLDSIIACSGIPQLVQSHIVQKVSGLGRGASMQMH